MSSIDTTNTTININSNLNIDETQGGKLAKAISDKLGTDSGITSVSYIAGEKKFEIGCAGEKVDVLVAKLQGLAFSNADMKEILGENVGNVSFKVNGDGEITLSTTDAAGKTTSKTGSISDFDIRELMKLLISAFSELRTADRDRALNVLNATVTALDTKIAAMEDAKEEQYKSALTSAIGSIVSGVCSIGMATAGGIAGIFGSKTTTDASFKLDAKGVKIGETSVTKMSKAGVVSEFCNKSAQGVGQIVSGTAGIVSAVYSAGKAEADIEATKADALLEILRQAQEQYSKGNDSLQQFIDKVLNIMQQLLQSASQTEKSVTAM